MKFLVLGLVICLVGFFIGCSSISIRPAFLGLGLNEAGYRTATYLLQDKNQGELTVWFNAVDKNINELSLFALPSSIAGTLKSITQLLTERDKIDAKAQRYINKGIKFLELSVEMEKEDAEELLENYQHYLKGILEGISELRTINV